MKFYIMTKNNTKLKELNPNDLIKELISLTEVHSFVEKIPSMSDIFISLVKGGSHE